MTLLTIIQGVTDELNLPRPSSVINNTNTTVRQLLSLANGSGKRMMKRYDFEELIKEFTHTTVATESQGTIATVVGDDYDRMESNSLWNRSKTRKVLGPYTPQEWQRDKGHVTSTIYDAFRLRGGNVLFTPTPTAGETIAGEYVSNEWVENAAQDNTFELFQADTDTSLISEDLLLLDVKWRWLRAHGFSYAEEKVEFERTLSDETGSDKGSRIIDLGTVNGRLNFTRANTPDGGFGS